MKKNNNRIKVDILNKDSEEFIELSKNLTKVFKEKKGKEISLIKYIIFLFGTIVAILGLFLYKTEMPNCFIITSLYMMISGIFIGLIIIAGHIYFNSWEKERKSIEKFNEKMIKKWRKNGAINELQYIGLDLTNRYRTNLIKPTKKSVKNFPRVNALYNWGLTQLPYYNLFKQNPLENCLSRIAIFTYKNSGIFLVVFYINTILAIIFLVIGIF